MGPRPLNRRELLLSSLLAGCDVQPVELQGGWVGAHADRGHRLRGELPRAGDGPLRRANVLIVGGGVSGLACARTLTRAGVDGVALLELDDEAGGNARGHQMAGMPCPLGAHYLPLPGPQATEVYQLLEDFGLVRQQFGRAVYDERQLCHAPQERLFFEGQWRDGLLPPGANENTRAQYRRFANAVSAAQKDVGFAMPSFRAAWAGVHGVRKLGMAKPGFFCAALTAIAKRWYCARVLAVLAVLTGGSRPSCHWPSKNSRSCGAWHSWRSSYTARPSRWRTRPKSSSN